MVFLIPLLLIIALIFGLDYYYFEEENRALKAQKIQENETPPSGQDREEFLRSLLGENEKN
ncbi:hypothetical protein [Campylobacter sp.]|uniref:hypothetical protein n=1 Tax=Campylobacter sp. TaxID=205 RepID=UPI0026DDBD0E|nr:hypothetical protein [Campylobacter sp.]MDO4674005.1 hypothetical protein [Campylobacter sp.]